MPRSGIGTRLRSTLMNTNRFKLIVCHILTGSSILRGGGESAVREGLHQHPGEVLQVLQPNPRPDTQSHR
jgi:hypothetical protein